MGGLAAAATWGAAHGAGGQSPFGRALPLAHGVVQGGFNELRGGSFKQGFISGVVGKLGGGLVHNSFGDSQLVERTIGIVVVSGVAAAASGAKGKDAVMRSAISVITIYLYNEMGMSFGEKMKKGWSIFRGVEFKKETVQHFNERASGGVVGSSLQGGASGFVGVIGASYSEGLVADGSMSICEVSTTCIQFGIGAHGFTGVSSSTGLSEPLRDGRSESMGLFMSMPMQSYSLDFNSSGAGVGRGLWGPGVGVAGGIQFCETEIGQCR